MQTLMISHDGFATAKEATQWANDLIGRKAPNNANAMIKSVLQFQLIEVDNGYSIVLLAEIEKSPSMSSMVMSLRKELNLNG